MDSEMCNFKRSFFHSYQLLPTDKDRRDTVPEPAVGSKMCFGLVIFKTVSSTSNLTFLLTKFLCVFFTILL